MVDNLIQAVIWLIVFGVLYAIINWGLGRMALPEPFGKILDWLLIGAAVVCGINIIMMVVGHPLFHLPRLFF